MLLAGGEQACGGASGTGVRVGGEAGMRTRGSSAPHAPDVDVAGQGEHWGVEEHLDYTRFNREGCVWGGAWWVEHHSAI